MPILGIEPHNLFPKSTGYTRYTTWTSERYMPIFGLEPTQVISEGFCYHALNYLGCRKIYADIGTRTNTVYFRRLLPTRVQLPGLQKEICRYWDSTKNTYYFQSLLATRVQLPGLQKVICQYWDSNQTDFFRRLQLTRLKLTGPQKYICLYW